MKPVGSSHVSHLFIAEGVALTLVTPLAEDRLIITKKGAQPWPTGNAKTADMKWRPTGRRNAARHAKRRANFWTIHAIHPIVRGGEPIHA